LFFDFIFPLFTNFQGVSTLYLRCFYILMLWLFFSFLYLHMVFEQCFYTVSIFSKVSLVISLDTHCSNAECTTNMFKRCRNDVETISEPLSAPTSGPGLYGGPLHPCQDPTHKLIHEWGPEKDKVRFLHYRNVVYTDFVQQPLRLYKCNTLCLYCSPEYVYQVYIHCTNIVLTV
jgi:hypothetical protein